MRIPKKAYRFFLYRYQILPITKDFQLSLLTPKITSAEDLIQNKNLFFAQALQESPLWQYSYGELIHRIQGQDENYFLIQLGVKRKETLDKPDFTKEEVENWPNLLIIINNEPTQQLIGIQFKSTVFSSTDIVADILQRNINYQLRKYNLLAYLNPISESHFFWDLVSKYNGQILQVDFEIVSPNMSSISKSLNEDFNDFLKSSNSQVSHLNIKSDPSSSLSLSEENKFLRSLVDYSSQGAGNISMKIKGLKKTIKTADNISETDIEQVTIENATEKELAGLLRILMK